LNLPNKLVTAISDYINDLSRALNVEYITAQFDKAEIQEYNSRCTRGRFTENLKKGNIYQYLMGRKLRISDLRMETGMNP
jgi:hypothetical protein